jgi:hypothetical protein
MVGQRVIKYHPVNPRLVDIPMCIIVPTLVLPPLQIVIKINFCEGGNIMREWIFSIFINFHISTINQLLSISFKFKYGFVFIIQWFIVHIISWIFFPLERIHSHILHEKKHEYMSPLIITPSISNERHSWLFHVCRYITLIINILNFTPYIIVKIIKIWYFENIHRDESNILYANIYFLFINRKLWSKHSYLYQLIWDRGLLIN